MQTFKKYLNPLYRDIEQVAAFDDLGELTELEQEEYPNLEKVTHIKAREINELLPRLERLEQELEDQIYLIDTEGDMDSKMEAKSLYNKLLAQIEELVERINNCLISLDAPYFGKLVFLPYDSRTGKPLVLYIGKFALMDEETNAPLITDWRSPISNIYYENSGPTDNISFRAPVGERRGDLQQKRQFQISRARIQGIYDAKSGNVAADEFLLSQLNERLGKKLQDIVSTIQMQQNSIIRGGLNTPILIQGVAGSGKTTILLHRLAYLFYTYKEDISPLNSLIIAPNQVFIDYVSDVLPSLGVEGVDTETYLFWGKSVLGWGDNFLLSNEEEDLSIKEYKGSLEFINVLDKYFEDFESNLLENIPYSRKDIIERRYYELKEEFRDIDMKERLELATDYAFAQKQFKQGTTGFFDDTHDTDLSLKRNVYDYFRRNCNIYSLYKNLFKSDMVTKETSKYTLKGLVQQGRNRYYRIEDLGPMVYLHLKIEGTKHYKRDYVVIDEAQDISFVQLATLLRIAKNGNLTIAGDLAQSIIPPFYIRDWDDVKSLITNVLRKETEYHQLQKCYRTTVEIVDFSNRVLRERFPKSYKLPEAVLRHGDDVNILTLDSNLVDLSTKDIKEVVKLFRDQFEKGAVTCALLCRDRGHADSVYNLFKEYEDLIGRQVISYDKSDYNSGLLVLPIENAKGLEFDSVVLADVNTDYYSENELDYRLLYVGITRALHRLHILTTRNKGLFGDVFVS